MKSEGQAIGSMLQNDPIYKNDSVQKRSTSPLTDVLDQLQERGGVSNSYCSKQIKPTSAETNLPNHSSGKMQKVLKIFTVDKLKKIAPSDQFVVDSSTVRFPASFIKEHQPFFDQE